MFAHKTTEGWEALLSGMVNNGWVVTGSWPIATEMGSRLRARDSASLSTSVHLVCRPRSPDASIGDWTEVARELPVRVKAWMGRLAKEGIRGADPVFACIGPAMEVYSRYSKVLDAQDREIPLGGDPSADEPYKQGFLAKVWEVVGRLALEKVLGSVKESPTSLEEDARLTALFLWTIQSSWNETQEVPTESLSGDSEHDQDREDQPEDSGYSGYSLPHDVVQSFCPTLRHPSGRVGRPHHQDRKGGCSPCPHRRSRRATLRTCGHQGCFLRMDGVRILGGATEESVSR